ncbi:hypothetical protein [Comamonas sp. HJ-2]
MTMISCPECNREISSTAKNCINCGAPIAKGKFWKIIKWFLAIAFLLFVAVMIFGTIVGNTPDAKSRAESRATIDYCWSEQRRKSLSPDASRFAASACERMERDFENKWGFKP